MKKNRFQWWMAILLPLLLAATLLIPLGVRQNAGLRHTLRGQGDLKEIKAYSEGIFIYSYKSDSYTFLTREGNERVYPASTGKLLTALLALELLPPETLISPGDEVYFTGKNASSAYIRPGHTLSVEMLIEGMLLPSGNDAAYALAAAGGRVLREDDTLSPAAAVEAYIAEMNAYAGRLGCTGSHFTVPDGLAGEENYSTLHDMALISKAAAKEELILRYAGMADDQVVYASGHTNTWVNSNQQLDEGSVYYDPHVKGLKTGSLDDYYCLITLYEDGEGKYLIGVFGSPTDHGRYEDTASVIEKLTSE